VGGPQSGVHRRTAAPPLSEPQLRQQLQDGLKIDPAVAGGVIAGLATKGLFFATADHVTTTPGGSTLYERLDAEVRRISSQIWGGLDEGDLEAAYRIHTIVTERANALLAGS
jgi:hypothetical protein